MLTMSKAEAADYARDGYIIRKGLLTTDEVNVFRDRARAQLEAENKAGAVMAKGDKEGKTTLLKMWNKAE
ncbi:phytanoyl-CoA dioxygenase family protein, partial [Rhizobiaceae sp. 2RAB30]